MSTTPNVIPVERHPWQPFLPPTAKVLMLGSFPPPRIRWSMEFYYPNFQNDMWRIVGLLFFDNKNYFVLPHAKGFDYPKITAFCTEIGIALFDTATAVRRLQANASDKFLEIVEPTDIATLLAQIPCCKIVAVTGEKAAETAATQLQCTTPAVGTYVDCPRYAVRLYRMPSSSRAYPLSLDRKASFYATLFRAAGLLA
ncbi:MAG: uracil-DNA glycosylase family protein [Paludibacteraceae bacterium]